jgi:hypothetical protein
MSGDISYKTHMLVGVRANGAMTVIADWPHLPKQVEVQGKIDAATNSYVTFLLCTPTSILPAGGGSGVSRRPSYGFTGRG